MEGRGNLSKVIKKACPVTKSNIIITYPDPEELVLTQRKSSEGVYEKVLRPRKEVKGGLSPTVECLNMGHPAIDIASPLGIELWKEGKVWCRKIKKECPTERIPQEF